MKKTFKMLLPVAMVALFMIPGVMMSAKAEYDGTSAVYACYYDDEEEIGNYDTIEEAIAAVKAKGGTKSVRYDIYANLSVEKTLSITKSQKVYLNSTKGSVITSEGTLYSLGSSMQVELMGNLVLVGKNTSITNPLIQQNWKNANHFVVNTGNSVKADVINSGTGCSTVQLKGDCKVDGVIYVSSYTKDATPDPIKARHYLFLNEYTGSNPITVKLYKSIGKYNKGFEFNDVQSAILLQTNDLNKVRLMDDEYEWSALEGSNYTITKKTPDTYNITVGDELHEATYNQKITVSEESEDFGYWVKNGEFVSSDNTYSFYACEDATIKAVYKTDDSYDLGVDSYSKSIYLTVKDDGVDKVIFTEAWVEGANTVAGTVVINDKNELSQNISGNALIKIFNVGANDVKIKVAYGNELISCTVADGQAGNYAFAQ